MLLALFRAVDADLASGKILIDSVDINDVSLEQLRDSMRSVPRPRLQSCTLIPLSLPCRPAIASSRRTRSYGTALCARTSMLIKRVPMHKSGTPFAASRWPMSFLRW